MLRRLLRSPHLVRIPQGTRFFFTTRDDWERRLEALRSNPTHNYDDLLSQYQTLIRERPHEPAILNSMYELYQTWKSTNNGTTATHFETMLNILCEQGNSAKSMTVLQDWHAQCYGNIELQPPNTMYDAVIATLAQDDDAPADAFAMGLELVSFLEQSYGKEVLPNANTYKHLIEIWEKSSSSTDALQLQLLTDKFFQQAPTKPQIWHVLGIVNKHLKAVDERHKREYLSQFLQLLDWLDEPSHLESSVQAYLSHIDPTIGSQLLARLTDLTFLGIPSYRHYTTMLEKYKGNAVEQEAILKLMMRCHKAGSDTTTFNDFLRALLLCGLPNRVLQMYHRNRQKRDLKFDPNSLPRVTLDTDSFTLVLQALAAPRENDSARERKERAQQAYSLLQKTVKAENRRYILTPEHFASVMVAFSKSPDPRAAEYCELVYRDLSHMRMKPNHDHICALIAAWGNSKHPNAAQRVFELYQQMESFETPKLNAVVLFALSKTSPIMARQLYERLGDSALNTDCFNSVSFSNPDMVESIFQRHWNAYRESDYSPQFRPNSMSYTACAKGNHNPINILDECERKAAEGFVDLPHTKLYTEVMRIYSDRGEAQTAEQVFQRMKDSYRSGNPAAKPDAHAVTTLLRAIARSKLPDKVRRCQILLEKMVSDYEGGDFEMKPTTFTYGAVLSACTTSEEPNVADFAFRIFGKVEDPNEHIFRYLFLVIARHSRDAKQKIDMAKPLLQRCCSAGYLDEAIIRVLEFKIPALFESLLDSQRRLSIPKVWSRNVNAPQR